MWGLLLAIAGIGVFVYVATVWMGQHEDGPESGCGCLRCMKKNQEEWERKHGRSDV